MKNNAPVFILILGDVLTQNVKEECEKALYLGLHIIPFLKSTIDGHISDETKNNMISISSSLYDKSCCTFCNCERLYEAVINRLKAYINDSIRKSIVYLKTRSDIYPQTAEMIRSAKRTVILCQNTSSLLLGYRNDSIEEKCYTAIIDWINSSDSRLTFVHIFSDSKTQEALQSADYIAVNLAKDNLNKLLSQKTGVRIFLRKSRNLTPCVVVDNSFLISLNMGTNTHYINLQPGLIKPNDVNTITNLLKKGGKPWISNNDTQQKITEELNTFYLNK